MPNLFILLCYLLLQDGALQAQIPDHLCLCFAVPDWTRLLEWRYVGPGPTQLMFSSNKLTVLWYLLSCALLETKQAIKVEIVEHLELW